MAWSPRFLPLLGCQCLRILATRDEEMLKAWEIHAYSHPPSLPVLRDQNEICSSFSRNIWVITVAMIWKEESSQQSRPWSTECLSICYFHSTVCVWCPEAVNSLQRARENAPKDLIAWYLGHLWDAKKKNWRIDWRRNGWAASASIPLAMWTWLDVLISKGSAWMCEERIFVSCSH